MGIVQMFADAGLIAAQERRLPDALAELAIRLDLAGAEELVTQLTNLTCWAVTHGAGEPGCRCAVKGTPNPQPIKPPPPPPPKPKGQT